MAVDARGRPAYVRWTRASRVPCPLGRIPRRVRRADRSLKSLGAVRDPLTELLIDVALLVLLLAVLAFAAMYAIDAVVTIASATGLSHFSAGSAIVAVATSLPEIGIAVFAVQSHQVGVTVGDVFGSNVADLALIAGIFLLISPVRQVGASASRGLMYLLVVASAVPLLLLVAGQGSRWIGVGLLALFGLYLYQVLRSRSAEEAPATSRGTLVRAALVFAVGIAVVLISARFVVELASGITAETGLGRTAIGATVVALGTSLPELSVDLVAVRRRLLELALGDIVGSCATNVTLVLGIVLVLTPVQVNFRLLGDLVGFALLLPVLTLLFLRKGQFSTWQPTVLLVLYGIFLAVTYGLVGFG